VTSVTKGGSQPHLLPRELIFELRELIPQHGLVCIRDRLYRRVGVRFSRTQSNNRAETNDTFVYSEELTRRSLTRTSFALACSVRSNLSCCLINCSMPLHKISTVGPPVAMRRKREI
jgi:hypothetical protein